MEDRRFKIELQGEKYSREEMKEVLKKRARGNGKVQAEGGIMKSSGFLVEEATVPASQHSLTLYRWWHGGNAHFTFKSGSECSKCLKMFF